MAAYRIGLMALVLAFCAAQAEFDWVQASSSMSGQSTGTGTHQDEQGSMSTGQGGNTGSTTGRNADSGSATGAVRDPAVAEPKGAHDQGTDAKKQKDRTKSKGGKAETPGGPAHK